MCCETLNKATREVEECLSSGSDSLLAWTPSRRAVMQVAGSDPAMPGDQAFSDTLLLTKSFDAAAVTGAFHYSQRTLPGSKEGEVLRSWARALGEPERLQRIENIYVRGRVETGGLSGLFEEWRVAKGQHKQNVELGEAYK